MNGDRRYRPRGAGSPSYLEYHGLAASAPREQAAGRVCRPRPSSIYNGAEAKLPATIAYLEKMFKIKVSSKPTRRSARTWSSRSAETRRTFSRRRRPEAGRDGAPGRVALP